MTGGTGFVGSNVVHEAVDQGHEVVTTYRSYRPTGREQYALRHIDMTDRAAVLGDVRAFAPDIVVHCAILNDLGALYRDRPAAWNTYVEATRITAEAAAAVDAAYVLVSTDWVFDGTQPGADESSPPNPVNLYGVLKMASEILALERDGAVARVSGVNGLHRARPAAPRAQDPGFGYFVASLVDHLARGRTFTVWESDRINMRATPSLASECAEMILDIGERRLKGVFHCSGADGVSRMEIARLACNVFDLDPGLLGSGPPDPDAIPGVPIPYDTTLTAPRTSQLLGRAPTPSPHPARAFPGPVPDRRVRRLFVGVVLAVATAACAPSLPRSDDPFDSVAQLRGHVCGRSMVGSAVVIDRGLLITAAHNVAGSEGGVTATFEDGVEHPVIVVGIDTQRDLALLSLSGVERPVIDLSDPVPGEPGRIIRLRAQAERTEVPYTDAEPVIAVGRDMYDQESDVRRANVRVRAAAGAGYSGGPVLNSNDEMTGLVYATAAPRGHDLCQRIRRDRGVPRVGGLQHRGGVKPLSLTRRWELFGGRRSARRRACPATAHTCGQASPP